MRGETHSRALLAREDACRESKSIGANFIHGQTDFGRWRFASKRCSNGLVKPAMIYAHIVCKLKTEAGHGCPYQDSRW